MPKLETKVIHKELEQGQIWPVYWIYGPEKMKARELLKRIRKAIFGEQSESIQVSNWSEESFDGSEVDSAAIVDTAQSPSLLGGSVKLIVVREAHALKNPEILQPLLGPAEKLSNLMNVCVFLSKDLDQRKKFSKTLIEKAAVVPCEEVPESQRESWIQVLAKRKNIELNPHRVASLATLDPWSLDIVDQELEKFALSNFESSVLLEGMGKLGSSEVFMDRFFKRELKEALPHVSVFSDNPNETLPLLGLMSWNTRQLAILISEKESGTRSLKLSPFLVERFQRWSSYWKLQDIQELQHELFDIDFKMKQTPLMPVGLWTGLVMRFCK